MKYTTIQVYENRIPIEHTFNKDERIDVPVSGTIPSDKLARVKYSTGITINLGNFQSAKVDVGIELPTHVDDIKDKYDEAALFCYENLLTEIGELQNLKKAVK